MKIRIVKTHQSSNGDWYYRVERKYWLGWFVTGGNDHCPGDQVLSLEEAKKVVQAFKHKEEVVMEVTL